MKCSFKKYLLISIIIILIALLTLWLPLQTLQQIILTIFLFTVGWIFVVVWSKYIKENSQIKFIKKIYILSFILRIGFVFLLLIAHNEFSTPLFIAESGGFFTDDLNYHERAIEISEVIENKGLIEGFNLTKFYYLGNFGFAFLNAIIYYLLNEPNTIIVRLINCLFGALVPVLCYQIAYFVYRNLNIARYSAIITAIFPTFIVLSAAHFKDTIIIFFILFIFSACLKVGKKIRLKDILLIFISLFILATFRYLIALALLALIAIYFLIIKGKKPSFKIVAIVAISLGIGILYLWKSHEYLRFYSPSFVQELSKNISYDYMTAQGDTSLIARLSKTASGKLIFLVFNFIIFLIGPLPNTQMGFFILIFPGVWTWYFLIPISIYGLLYSIKFKTRESWFLYSIVFIIIATISVSFFGSNFRYREQIMPILIIFSTIGIINFKKIKHLYILYLFFMFLFLLTYLYIKYHV